MSGATAEAKARVDALLMQPLAGLARKRGISAEAHEKSLERLRSFLTYMSDTNLSGLVDLIARHAAKGVWPEEGLVRAWAMTLQVPPPRDCAYARSLIRSAMGRRAMEEGWAVELFQVARRLGPPPGKYIIANLKRDAEEHRHRRRVIRENIEAGLATNDEKAWLEGWHADLAEVEAIQSAVEEGAAA
ncbi:hypothetical protein PAF17_10465 [Paracoccus sp. Z330]|uniref:Uncharacterized protein n=1 Tax=Paracoccus onchidii TaxID=3017813 RepID=A0ABT4ZG24_9RHOB|nr:hypothetical protein [Paracoccus onchidii]MDB6177923.1 hypothetical protein [Paracoccus onchidii]